MTLRATLHRTLAALATTAALLVTAVPAGAAPAPSPTPDAAPAGAAPAADGGFRWAVQPSSKEGPTGRNYFVYDLAPGDRITDYVGISNLGTEPMTFSVYGTDAFTTDDGSFALLPASDKPTDVGSWIKFAQGRYTVQPGQRLDIPFRLTVPANATPGDHAGGVIGALAQIETDAAGQRINVDRRIAARVYLRVAGELNPAVAVESVDLRYDNPLNPVGGGEAVIVYQVRNTGNVRLGGTGTVTITGPFGWELARTTPGELPELLPGATITVTERITGVLPAMRLTAEVELDPRAGDQRLEPVTRASGVWAPPWVLVGLVLIGVGYLVLRRIRNQQTAAEKTSAAPQLAEKTSAAEAAAKTAPAAEGTPGGTTAATPDADGGAESPEQR
ncbi:WxL protein peptidoglycan domain-containing protein [Melissospora conviva]|uniref:WxL protein peptidoglycan domain-containing protein n=1 Tax=Melissospora conviva TaxID=3388432 RepID=UPI003B819EF3